MFPDLSRAQQRFLGLTGARRQRSDEEAELPTVVRFDAEAKDDLLVHAYATGRARGGPLFGLTSAGQVTVVAAVPNGYPSMNPLLWSDPLICDQGYVLGWSDSLTARYAGRVDWVGQWIMRPDSQLGTPEEHLTYVRRAVETDLVNMQHFLCFVGWADGHLKALAYTYDQIERQLGTLHVDLWTGWCRLG